MILPEILKIPPKLHPILIDFNKYKIFVIEGGRGSSKTQSVARLLLYVAEKNKVRIFCGREVQNTIEESVFTALGDLISDYKLAYVVKKTVGIVHLVSGSTFKFKGFREQGSVNIKGVEGADIIWVDEAQTITKPTLDVILPTLRKSNVKFFFTLNRYMRDDAVMDLIGRDDCLHIHVDYFENPFCPLTLKNEAALCKARSERDYKHIWLGHPLAQADDYLFNYDKLVASYSITPWGGDVVRQRVMGIDFAAQGNDSCVATILDRVTSQHWTISDRIKWDENDAMVSVGRIVNLIGKYKPDVCILDVGGMGSPVHNRLTEVGMRVQRFDGATTDGINTRDYANARAEGYYTLCEWFDQGFLIIDQGRHSEVIQELGKLKVKYRSDGKRLMQAKVDMKKEIGYSPDNADSLMMAVYGAVKYLGQSANMMSSPQQIVRVSGTRRRR